VGGLPRLGGRFDCWWWWRVVLLVAIGGVETADGGWLCMGGAGPRMKERKWEVVILCSFYEQLIMIMNVFGLHGLNFHGQK